MSPAPVCLATLTELVVRDHRVVEGERAGRCDLLAVAPEGFEALLLCEERPGDLDLTDGCVLFNTALMCFTSVSAKEPWTSSSCISKASSWLAHATTATSLAAVVTLSPFDC